MEYLLYNYYRGFVESEGKATIPLNISASGDITIMVYHARSTFGGKIQGKVKCPSTPRHRDKSVRLIFCIVSPSHTYIVGTQKERVLFEYPQHMCGLEKQYKILSTQNIC